MKNIKKYFNGGKYIESFVILPQADITWMTLSTGRYYELNIGWMFWYFTIGNINSTLKQNGYY